jgi:AcrR family transcriptional regulator
MAKPLTREERRAHTRARLLDGARAVFARRGYQAATVDEVAEEAGFTTGALYSNFKGKEDLFLAVVEDMIAREVREYTEIFERGTTFEERSRGGADRWMELLGQDPDYFRLFIELWSAAIRDPGLRAKFAERSGAMRDATTRMIEAGSTEMGVEAPREDARMLATVVNALGNGLAMEKLMFPGSVPDNLFGDILAVLFRALADAAGQAPAGEREAK